MTLEQLQAYVWRRAPLGRFIAGRKTLDELVQLAVENWEPEYLNHCTDDIQRSAVASSIVRSIKRGHQVMSGQDPQEYGFVWMFLLQMLASAVVQILIKWWLERASNRVWLVTMQAELTK